MSGSKIAIIGLGYVGLPLALLADRKGYSVTGIVRNPNTVEKLNNKIPTFKDEAVEKYLPTSNLTVTNDFSKIKGAEIVIVCVPTPIDDNHMPDYGPVVSACESIGKHLEKGQLIILESTVNPGVSEDVMAPILEESSGLKCGIDFFLSHCPERINPGDPKWNVENINRVVGGFDDESLERAATFYRTILTASVKEMGSLKEAEACKVVENSFRDINIAFVNELALSFSKLGIDVVNVIDGAATKPFAFMAHYPGCGVGGHCIPVDPYYLIEYAKKNGFHHDFLSLARRINNQMPQKTVELMLNGLNSVEKSVKGSKIAFLGLSYKGNIDDDRESPAYEMLEDLKNKGAILRIYDPYIPAKSNVNSIEEALEGADAILLATTHKEFKVLTPELLKKHGIKVLVDGRNFLSRDAFKDQDIYYKGIGRTI